MAASPTTAERLAVTEERVERIQDDVSAVNSKLDSHAVRSYDNHEAMKKDLGEFKTKVGTDVAGLRSDVNNLTSAVKELVSEIKKPSGLMGLLVEVWRNPAKAGQMLLLLATLGSIVAGFGAWLRGGMIGKLPDLPDLSAIVVPASGAELQDPIPLRDDKHPIDPIVLPTTFEQPPITAGDTDVP